MKRLSQKMDSDPYPLPFSDYMTWLLCICFEKFIHLLKIEFLRIE